MNDVDKLGTADIRLAGLQIWVHSRQFPEHQDYWDGNWLNITAHCGEDGADVWVNGPVIHLSELARWVSDCETMYRTVSGEASLKCMEPELAVHLRVDKCGHVLMQVLITPDHMMQE